MKSLYPLLLLCISAAVLAQEKQDSTSKKEELKIDSYYVDFAVPDLAAYTLLGIDNDQVSRPGNLKEFAIGLSSLTGTNGKFNPSIGVEYSPFITLNKNLKQKTNADKGYWDHRFQPANIALTFGTQIDDSLGNRAAVGFKWVPVDFSDPLGDKEFYNAVRKLLAGEKTKNEVNYISTFNEEVTKLLRSASLSVQQMAAIMSHIDIANDLYRAELAKLHNSGKIGSLKVALKDSLATVPAYNTLPQTVKDALSEYIEEFVDFTLSRKPFQEGFSDRMKELKEEFKKKHWNALVVQFSAGWVWNSDSATFDDLSKEKYAAFLGVSTPLWFKSHTWAARHTQAIAQIQYTNDKSKLTAFASKLSAGGRILIGNSDNRLSLEGMYSDITYDAKKDDGSEIRETSFRWAIGGEFKLSQGSWIEIALGGQKLINGDTRILPSFSLKHALQNKRRFETN